MEEIKQATKVQVLIDYADGSTARQTYYERGEPFEVIEVREMGEFKAEYGKVTFTLPRHPTSAFYVPPPKDT